MAEFILVGEEKFEQHDYSGKENEFEEVIKNNAKDL